MSVVVANSLIEVVEHLRPGSIYREDNVRWEEYEQLLQDLAESGSVRVYYDQGRMEIMSPLRKHEAPVGIIERLMAVLSDELNLEIEPLRSTTLKSAMREQGAEPDASFYVQNAAAVIGKDDLDLRHDPPPDIVIESDLTSSSLDKFPIYAGLGVIEIWRVEQRQVQIHLLSGNTYQNSFHSQAFTFLNADILTDFISQGINQGATAAARAFRKWIREHLPAS